MNSRETNSIKNMEAPKHFFWHIFTGPTQVNQTADLLRLHFANCEVLEGTERVWVHMFAHEVQTVERRQAGLPSWMRIAESSINVMR